MKKEQWQNGIDAWKKVQEQATIDLEQAELYIKAIENKMAEKE